MTIRHLLCVACLTSVFACGGDDGDTETGNDSTTDPTDATMTDPTVATMTDPTVASMTDPTDASTTDPTDATATGSSSGDPTDATLTDTGSSSGDPTAADSGSSGESGGASPECQNYCDLFQENCDGGVGGSDSYPNAMQCLAACSEFSEEGLACRTGHLDGSLTGNPELNEAYYMTHCPHADADGGGVCMD